MKSPPVTNNYPGSYAITAILAAKMESQEYDRKVTLWDLLTVISFIMPFAGVFAKHPNQKNVGILGYALLAMAGVALGIGFAAAMRWALLVVGKVLQSRSSDRVQTVVAVVMLFAAVVWIVFGDAVGYWIGHRLLNVLP